MYHNGLYLLKSAYWRSKSILLKTFFITRYRGVYLGKNIQIIGLDNIEIGKGSTLGDYLWINVNNRDNKKSVHIGKYSNIGRNNFISVGDKLTIGDYFLSSCYCSIIGASHKYTDPFTPYLVSGVTLGKGIYIGPNVFMGAHAMVVGHVNIGFGSIIGAGALVNKDIPPLSIVVGNPARVIRRYSPSQKKWVSADKLIENDLMHEDEYLNMIKRKYPRIGSAYHAATERMGWL